MVETMTMTMTMMMMMMMMVVRMKKKVATATINWMMFKPMQDEDENPLGGEKNEEENEEGWWKTKRIKPPKWKPSRTRKTQNIARYCKQHQKKSTLYSQDGARDWNCDLWRPPQWWIPSPKQEPVLYTLLWPKGNVLKLLKQRKVSYWRYLWVVSMPPHHAIPEVAQSAQPELHVHRRQLWECSSTVG